MTTIRTPLKGTLILSLVSLVACGDPLKDGQKLEDPRVLAVTVFDEEGSATPAAGEAAELSFLVAGPEGPQEGRIAYQICEAADSARGVPFCAGELLADGEVESEAALLGVSFTVPEATLPGTRLAVLAVLCTEGAPELAEDPLDWACSDESAPFNLSFDLWTAPDSGEKNANPDLVDLAIEVREQAVSLDDPHEAPACGDGVVELDKERTHTFSFRLGEAAREGEEWLQVSHFSTAGLFEHQFSVMEPEEDAVVTLSWEAPKTAGPVKQYLVVRDGLGGVSFVSWTVCVR